MCLWDNFSYQEYPERLLLTYRPEPEEGAEDTEVSVDESNPLPVDDVASSDVDVPPPSPPPPPANLDTGDLLVKFSELITFILIFDIFLVPSGRTCDAIAPTSIHGLQKNIGHDTFPMLRKNVCIFVYTRVV